MNTKNLNRTYFSMISLLSALIILCVIFLGLYHLTIVRPVEARTINTRELSFKSVSITTSDTLWSIAKENYTEEYGSLKNYIKEIKRCNSLTSDRINAGSSLLVPIYVPANSYVDFE